MQSESTEYPTSSKNTIFEQTSPLYQHGFHSPASDRHHAFPAGSVSESNGVQLGSEGNDANDAGLNGTSVNGRRQPSQVKGISEYENALLHHSPSPKTLREGLGFSIVPFKPRKDGKRLDQFPNEVLTHVLSHLQPNSLTAVSLVSRKFYDLVTTPHAWRIAFSRYFPGQDAVDDDFHSRNNRRGSDQEERHNIPAEQRFFTRLTPFASWRSEYIIRTRLLRSLGRGKPQQGPQTKNGRSFSSQNNANSTVTYNSQLSATVNRIHAVFGDGKKGPRFMHGTDESGHASVSDPNTGKVDNWSMTDFQMFPQFVEVYTGEQQYGLGEGKIVGAPNVMDVSQPYGSLLGEGFPGGFVYYRHPEEKRGRFLAQSVEFETHPVNLLKVPSMIEAITAVWIAKTPAIPTMTNGLVGIMTGSSCGIVTGYSVGLDKLEGRRLARGEITCRWVLSPGVPIIGLRVDDCYGDKRKANGRVWAVALNALGEAFYLQDMVHRPVLTGVKPDAEALDVLSWETGRSVAWQLIEPTRRVAKEDPYDVTDFVGSYSPRSSPASSHLTAEQLRAENKEIEAFFKHDPAYWRKTCEGWDMRRKLEVDFGGEDGHAAGENIVVIQCGGKGDETEPLQIERLTRAKFPAFYENRHAVAYESPAVPKSNTPFQSIFGRTSPKAAATPGVTSPAASDYYDISREETALVEEWKTTKFAWNLPPVAEVTATAIDESKYALLTAFEDPILTANGGSTSSLGSTPSVQGSPPSLVDVPGYRGRFIAIGTKDGDIAIYNMRAGQSTTRMSGVDNLQPVRTISTDSPQISCLALSALYLVHGGNDGLVQAWDVLGSQMEPIRTLNSRFSSRARRRLVQAEASAQGVGINLFAAGAIALDPDPTSLKGIVSLGTHLRYWAYSSSAADEVSSKKRRLRRGSERGNNSSADRYTQSGRGALMDYIVNEQEELTREKVRREKEDEHLHGRFGVGLAGLSDEEALAYAELLSQEAAAKEEERRFIEANASPAPATPSFSEAVTPVSSPPRSSAGPSAGPSSSTPRLKTEDELDADMEEAIRLSLESHGASSSPFQETTNYMTPPRNNTYDVPFVVKSGKKSRRSNSTSPATSQVRDLKGKGKVKAMDWQDAAQAAEQPLFELDDLDYALQLSLAEELSRKAADGNGAGGSSLGGSASANGSGAGDKYRC